MAVESASGYEVMTAGERQFLLDSGAPANSFDPEVKARARESLRVRAELTRQQAAPELTAVEVGSLLGCSKSTVSRWTRSCGLYAIWRGRERRYPAWQFVDRAPLPGLQDVLSALQPSMHPYSVEGWMTGAQEELDDLSPVEWLAAGRSVDPVVQIADSIAHM